MTIKVRLIAPEYRKIPAASQEKGAPLRRAILIMAARAGWAGMEARPHGPKPAHPWRRASAPAGPAAIVRVAALRRARLDAGGRGEYHTAISEDEISAKEEPNE